MPMKLVKLKPHPLADLIPPMSEEEYTRLRDDIKEQGLLEAITLYEGMILDGRHRYRACEEVGTGIATWEYDGDTPARYVITLNANRRNLTVAQRAAIALSAVGPYEKEARARLQEGQERGRLAQKIGSVPIGTLPFANSPTKRATAAAAADVGISGRMVDRLKRIKEKDADLFVKVSSGEMKIGAADQILQKRDQVRKRDTEKPYEITSEKSRINAEAAKRRLEALLAALSGHSDGLKGFDTPRAMAAATPGELRGWIGVLDEAIRQFRGLRSTLREGARNGSQERTAQHTANTSEPADHRHTGATRATNEGASQATRV